MGGGCDGCLMTGRQVRRQFSISLEIFNFSVFDISAPPRPRRAPARAETAGRRGAAGAGGDARDEGDELVPLAVNDENIISDNMYCINLIVLRTGVMNWSLWRSGRAASCAVLYHSAVYNTRRCKYLVNWAAPPSGGDGALRRALCCAVASRAADCSTLHHRAPCCTLHYRAR